MNDLELVKARIAAAQQPEFDHVYGVTILAVDHTRNSIFVSCMVSGYPTDNHPIGTVLGVYLTLYGDEALLRACGYETRQDFRKPISGRRCRLKVVKYFTRQNNQPYPLPTWAREHEFGDEPECEKCGIYGPDGGEHEPCEPQQQKKEG